MRIYIYLLVAILKRTGLSKTTTQTRTKNRTKIVIVIVVFLGNFTL